MTTVLMPSFRLRHVTATLVLVACSALTLSARAAEYHHVHLNAPNAAAGAKWYADHLGGELKKVGVFAATGFGKVNLIFFQAKPGFPGSVGSTVDHVGFTCRDLPARLDALQKAGVEIVSPIAQDGPIKSAMVKDPWGTLIELVEDPDAERVHHIHLAAVDPEAALAWYAGTFGGQPARYEGQIPGVRFGDVWIFAKKVDQPPAKTQGRSIDHLGWSFADLDAAAVDLEAKGVKWESKPFAFGAGKIAFILDPWGTRIELVGPGKKQP